MCTVSSAFVLLFGACSGSLPQPGPGHARWAEGHGFPSDLNEMRQGRELYVERCDGCHSLPRLHKYAPEDWPAWMDSMRTEFREAGAEWDQRTEALILNYLSVASGHLRDSLASLASGQSQTANPD